MATDDPRFRKEWIEQARQIKRRLTRGPLDVSIEADRDLFYELHDCDTDPTLRLRQSGSIGGSF